MRFFLLLVVVLTINACSPSPSANVYVAPTDSPERIATISADPTLQTGERLYYTYCAHCHGYTGEGQPESSAELTLSLGLDIVPPHNATGHTWQHPDQLLMEVIRVGIPNPLNHFPMLGYQEQLTDDEIMAILEFIKLWWTDEQRAHQRAVTNRWDND